MSQECICWLFLGKLTLAAKDHMIIMRNFLIFEIEHETEIPEKTVKSVDYQLELQLFFNNKINNADVLGVECVKVKVWQNSK